jgi:type VI secretion system protein VasG
MHVLPRVADRLIEAMATGHTLKRAHATLDSDACVVCEFG